MPGNYFNPLHRVFLNLSGGTVTGNTLFTQSVSATTLFSGTTNLSTTIINVAAATGDFTRVQGSATIVTGGTVNAPTLVVQNVVLSVNAGSNISTGGTQTAPTISVAASPSLNSLTLSGAGQFAAVTSTGLSATTIQSNSLTSTGLTRMVEATSGGTLVATKEIISAFITATGVTSLLSTASNWDITGTYTGATITGTFQGQEYYDSNYFYKAVADDVFIRLIRG